MKYSILFAAVFGLSFNAHADLKLHKLEDPTKGISPMTLAQEERMIAGLVAQISASVTTMRDAHPKAHGCVQGTLTVNSDLAAEYRAGVFAKPGAAYPAIVRFSHGSSNPLADDREPSPQGMATKILLPAELQSQVEDIPGEEYFLPKDVYKTFDIIGINGVEEFVVNSLTDYPAFIKATVMLGQSLAKAKASGKSKLVIGLMSAGIIFKEYIAKVPLRLTIVVGKLFAKLSQIEVSNVLAEQYNSWAPYAFDDERAVKYSWKPCTELRGVERVAQSENFLGQQLASDVKALGEKGCFELVAQFHERGMPSVEDAALPWGDADERKRVSLAKLHLSQDMLEMGHCQMLSFNPAHALPNQRGIGATMRARRLIYAAIETKRNTAVTKGK